MGWKGTVRSIRASYRAAERDAQRRRRELERERKAYAKMEELAQAEFEVEVYENEVELLLSVHKECGGLVDWQSMASASQPFAPEQSNKLEKRAKKALRDYKPGLFTRLFKREHAVRERLTTSIEKSREKDEANYEAAVEQWKADHKDWKESGELARRIVAGDRKAMLEAIKDLDPFSDISQLGSHLEFQVWEEGIVEATLHVHSQDVVPGEVKSLLKSGKLSVKKMPKGQFNELFQDYVCGCALRVANELFSILPIESTIITAVDQMLNTKTGHLEETPVLSALIPRKTLERMNLEGIDPSDSMENFVHNMNFKKTKGFEGVERLRPDCVL